MGTRSMRRHGFLGRFRLGQPVGLGVRTISVSGQVATPDAAPVASIYSDSGVVVASVALPVVGPELPGLFQAAVPLGRAFALGRYRVCYAYSVAGSPRLHVETFDVIGGGDPDGSVISLYAYDRPEARYVVAQLSSGKLVQGRNPRL